MIKGIATADRTFSGDERYTPDYAVYPLLEFLGEPDNAVIWCPFDKPWSAYVRVFGQAGYKVVATHIDDGQDFFLYQPENYTVMISNPPFSKKDAVLERAYALGKPFALLLPINAIQGRKRFEIFQNKLELLCFDQRIGYIYQSAQHPSESTPFASAYFCNGFLPSKLELRRLKKERSLCCETLSLSSWVS